MKLPIVFILSFLISYNLQAQFYTLDEKASTIEWTGKAAFSAYALSGTIEAKSGKAEVNNRKIISTNVIIDTRTIYSSIKRLKKHLHSEDFFFVKEYPTASFELSEFIIVDDSETLAKGKMTIRGKTNPVEIPLNIELSEQQMRVNGTAKINRTNFGVNYNSPSIFASLKDQAIADDFEVKFNLVFLKK